MKTVISMKIINCNNWAPRNALNIPIPITDPPVDLQGLLGKLYFAGGVARIYYNLFGPTITYHYFYEEDQL